MTMTTTRRAALWSAVGFPINIRIKKRHQVLAKLFCNQGPELTLEIKGELFRLSEREHGLVAALTQQMREFHK